MNEHHTPLDGRGLRMAIVAGRFNDMISRSLVDGARERLLRLGVDDDAIDLIWVPGAYEIPAACAAVARTGRVDAVIALGAVIRGATPHFDHVAGQCAAGLQRVGLDAGIPAIFGVLTTDTIEQAIERAGTKAGNKGADAADAAVEMAHVLAAPLGDAAERATGGATAAA
ncbi:MAG: 6,7-dimethyl-8-ribityllumazine synthase [Actinomycetota bacterium]